jgi:hypothetical protein
MGSILSFNVLCIINLFTYVRALPKPVKDLVFSGKLSINRLPVLINGDDILFRAFGDMYSSWKTSSSEAGFTLSQGKNFLHPIYATVNSTPISIWPRPSLARTYSSFTKDEKANNDLIRYGFYLDIPGKRPKLLSWADFDELPLSYFRNRFDINIYRFSNLSLLLSTANQVVNKFGVKQVLTLRDFHEGAVLGALDQPRAHGQFLHYHKKAIREQTQFGRGFDLNLFAHPLLGGLGFTVPNGVQPRFSEPQRHLALVLKETLLQQFIGPADEDTFLPLQSLRQENLTVSSLGNKGSKKLVYLEVAPMGPLPEGFTDFDEDFSISPSPLTQPFTPPDSFTKETVLNCRLPSQTIYKLIRGANHHRKLLLPISEMTTFPYRRVRVLGDSLSMKFKPSEGPERILVLSEPILESPIGGETPVSEIQISPTEAVQEPSVPSSSQLVPDDESWIDQEFPGLVPPPLPRLGSLRRREGTIRRREQVYSAWSQGLRTSPNL